jgi:hypothetical protein
MDNRNDERLRPGEAASLTSSAYIADVRTGGMGMRAWLTRIAAAVSAVAWAVDARVRGWLTRAGVAVAAGTRLRAWLIRGGIALAVAAAAAGLGLAVAGVQSPVRTALVLLFLAAGPTAAVAGLLRGFPPATRLIIAFAADIVVIGLVAIVMLGAGLWSPTGGLLVVAGLTLVCLVAQLPSVRRIFRAGRATAGEQSPAVQYALAGDQAPAPAGEATAGEVTAEAITAETGHRHP